MPTLNSQDTPKRSILVTDSGLGGLSVFNELAKRVLQESPWPGVRLTYVNAWPAPHRGYNHFETDERRFRVFGNALESMRAFDPDLILIACNTLSVIYPHTRFSAGIPVRGIVDDGVEMLYQRLKADPESVAVILGTPTTTRAKSHETGLMNLGIPKDRIINTGCTDLAGWIEREPFSEQVGRMIQRFARETGEKLKGFNGNVYAGLCCTHFGYRQALFQSAFDRFVPGRTTFLNPNIRMAEKATEPDGKQGTPLVDLSVEIVSQAQWRDEQIRAYTELMTDMPEAVRNGLENYRLDPELFSTD